MTLLSFKIQILTEIIKDKRLKPIDFALYTKITHLYNIHQKQEETPFFHSEVRSDLLIQDNRTLKNSLERLYECGYILNEIKSFPKKLGIGIKFNPDYLVVEKDDIMFTQLPSEIVSRRIVSEIGHIGVRLLYYYESYINRKTLKNYAHPAEETTSFELNIDLKTVREYNSRLKSSGLVRIQTSKHEGYQEYIKKGESDVRYYRQFNNKYYVKLDNFHKKGSKIDA